MNEVTVPLFPLNTVLFPDGILSLRLFEPRYIDMVSNCMKSGTDFGVCLIREGRESGPAASIYPVGTLAGIIDFQTLPDGLLGITAVGKQRFAVNSHRIQPDQLCIAEIEIMPAETECELPNAYLGLTDLLKQAREHLGQEHLLMPEKYGDAGWVGCRLAELLPIGLAIKQELLEINDHLQRLERIYTIIKTLDARKAD